jgi:signal transduction histidine kinase
MNPVVADQRVGSAPYPAFGAVYRALSDARLARWFREQPQRFQIALDGTMALLVLVTFGQLGHPDLLFHAVWVVLAIQGFVFGLRRTLVRIGLATSALAAYWATYSLGLVSAELDLIEWPLMFVIAVLVAVMADRVGATSRHYARLYRLTNDRLLTAQEAERNRLALDLHDGVGQIMAALSLTLEAASAAGDTPSDVRRSILRARQLAATATDETRNVAQRLRPARLDKAGLAAALHELANHAGLPVQVRVGSPLSELDHLDPSIAVSVFRIVQEALANAARHSAAGSTLVTLARAGGELIVTVRDDGQGFNTRLAADRGLGLPGMRERARLVRGTLSITCPPGGGTLVRLSVPLLAEVKAMPIDAELSATEVTP